MAAGGQRYRLWLGSQWRVMAAGGQHVARAVEKMANCGRGRPAPCYMAVEPRAGYGRGRPALRYGSGANGGLWLWEASTSPWLWSQWWMVAVGGQHLMGCVRPALMAGESQPHTKVGEAI